MTTQTLIDAMSTSSWWPEAAGTLRLNQELAMAATPNPSPCEEVVDAARKASTNRPITSSMTAAPRMTEMQQVDRSGAERHTHEQLAEDGRDSPALAKRGSDLHRRQQDGHQQRELKSGWHRPLTVYHGEILAPSPPPEAAQTAQQRKGTLIAPAFDSLSQHRPDRRGLRARQLRLREVLRQQGCLPRMLLRLPADAQPHPQLAHLQLSDEAVGREPHSLAQLLQRFLHFQFHAERHPKQDAKLRDFGVRRDAFAK